MASRLILEKIQLKTLQKYHHQNINCFGEHETLVDAIKNRPGFLGANPVSYLSLLARRPNMQLADLDEALIIDRSLLRASAFRGSLFLLPSEDYGNYYRTFHQYLLKRGMQKLLAHQINEIKLNRFAEILNNAISDLPVTIPKILELLFPGRKGRPSDEVCYHIIQKLCDLGVIVRATAKGWKGNDFTYALFKKWIPDVSLSADNPETARTETIRKYLRCYGPASLEDIVWWTGLSMQQCQRSIGNLRREAVRFHVESYKDDMIGLKESIELIRKKSPIFEEVQLLPPWDPYTFGWRCQKRLADKEILPFIYDSFGNATSVIMDIGKAIGLWQFKDSDVNIIEFHIFSQYTHRKRYALQKIETWANSLAKVTGSIGANIIEVPLPDISLKTRKVGSFLWPLGKRKIKSDKAYTTSPVERRTSNTFRKSYLDNDYLVRPNMSLQETRESEGILDQGF